MQFSTLLALAPLAMAAPLSVRDTTDFTVISAHSGSPIHLRSWVIRNSGIFLNGASSAYCPLSDCSGYSNTSAFAASPGDNVGVSLDAVLAGGQQLYVAKDGTVGYTIPHSGAIPDGADRTGFTFEAPPSSMQQGHLGYAAHGADGFVACEAENGDYQIFANVEGGSWDSCIGMSALAYDYTGNPAYEY